MDHRSLTGQPGRHLHNTPTHSNNDGRTDASLLPFDNTEENEKSVLDFVVSGRDSRGLVVESLTVEDFRSKTHRLIFGAIHKLCLRSEPVDALTIRCELADTPRPDGGDWSSYLTSVLPTALPIVEGNLEYQIAKIKEAPRLRKTSELAYCIFEAANRGDSENVLLLLDILVETQVEIGAHNHLKPISARDLRDISPPQSIWARFIYPGCITQLNAEPGAGKSTLLYNIASFGALGKDFIDIPFSKPIKTLYIDLESPQWLQRQKIETICDELPENFHLLSDFNLKRDTNDLIRLAKSGRYDLIVFDTQSKALNMEDENDNSEANRAAALLKKLATKTEAAILLIHHTKKGEGGRDVYRGRGASAIAAAVDIVANLKSQSHDILKLEIAKSRVPGVYPSIAMKKIGDDKFERVSSDEIQPELKSSQAQEFILDLLGDEGERQTADIHKHAETKGYKTRTIENELKRLVDNGKIFKPRQGIYKLATTPIAKLLNGDHCRVPDEI